MVKKIYFFLIAIGLVGTIGWAQFFYVPNPGPLPKIDTASTPEKLARGRYLATHVMVCIDCHSQRNWKYFSGPLIAGTEGCGGEVYPPEAGFPGTFVSPNITPFKTKNWKDEDFVRAIAAGVNTEGRALFPLMPYPRYSKMDPNDLESIVVYLKSLPQQKNDPPPSQPRFPFSLILKSFPMAPKLTAAPSRSNPKEYGKYLCEMAACLDCHTPQKKGKPLPGKFMAGGMSFLLHGGRGTVFSSNITPDSETGIGDWEEDFFIHRFKSSSKSENLTLEVRETDFNTVMPWTFYGGMTEEDLRAIYAYLASIPPIQNSVPEFIPGKSKP